MISVDTTALFIFALVFGLVFVLKNHFFEPLASAMETRRNQVDEARALSEDGGEVLAEAQTKIDRAVEAARNQGYQLLDEARSGAQAKARATIEAGRDKANQQIADARAQLRRDADQAVKDLEGRAKELAKQIAGRILGRQLA